MAILRGIEHLPLLLSVLSSVSLLLNLGIYDCIIEYVLSVEQSSTTITS